VSTRSVCTATVSDSSGGTKITPTGIVNTWASDGGGSFYAHGTTTPATACTLSSGSCQLDFVPSTAAVQHITATYGGDPNHSMSSGSFTLTATAPTSLLYTGTQIVILGTTATAVTPSAQLSSGASVCLNGQTIAFSASPNPTGGSSPLSLGTAVTNASGVATATTVSASTGWFEGVYQVTASFAGSIICDPSSNPATLTVGSAGDSATGGGWYTLPSSGRLNFGFTIQTVPNTSPTAYKGQLVLMNNGKWMLKGSFSGTNAYTRTGSGQGAANGIGDLYWWNQTLSGGLGDWQLAQSVVQFTISLDQGTNVKSSTCNGTNGEGCFGIQISYTPVSPQPSKLPNSQPTAINGGSIKVR
jgi:hypothetical protein